MSSTPTPIPSRPRQSGSALRNIFLGALFPLVLLVPKIIHLRRNPRFRLFFRIFLGVAGAALVLVPLTSGNNYVLPIVGLVMFVSVILLPSTKPQTTVDEKSRELGALVVVNGGHFRPVDATSSSAVQLFVGAEHISVLDAHFQSLLEIPAGEITSARAEQTEKGWLLEVAWSTHVEEFSYRGVFAERLVRVAETTLHSVMRPAFPVIPQRRAAGA
ncbi:MAG: hypothetical protein DMG35_07170 [Acidobacteria bacterium]|nr:MAG: hypothetical protein DMG35_07170 [Acidobacteriota bacterium]